MDSDSPSLSGPVSPKEQGGIDPVHDPGEYRRKVLAIGLEVAKNAVRARTLDELQFVLVNDLRALLPFDRSLLLEHFDGKSVLAATNNQPKLERKSDFVQRVNSLALSLQGLDRALVLMAQAPRPTDVPQAMGDALEEYMKYSGCVCLTLVPLSTYDSVIGHLVFEYFGELPGELETLVLMNMVPFFSSALAEKWVLANVPSSRQRFLSAISSQTASKRQSAFRTKMKFLALAAAAVIIVLCLPFTVRVGGRAEVIPDYEYHAYVQMDGIIEKVLIKEGDSVKKAQVLATLEDKEIEYKIREAQRQQESFKAEIEILRGLGAENSTKLAESQLVAIKSLRAKQELEFLNWQKQFLNVRSPVDGIILTKKVETLIGKRFKAGESFCRIAPHQAVVTEIFVRESDIPFVEQGQAGAAFYNYKPNQSYPFIVQRIAPKSEALERLGSVFRVRGEFVGQPSELKPGMLGTARIDTKKASLWFILTRRIRAKLSEVLVSL